MPVFASLPLLKNSGGEPAQGIVVLQVTAPFIAADGSQITMAASVGQILDGRLLAKDASALSVPVTPTGIAVGIWLKIDESDGTFTKTTDVRWSIAVPNVATLRIDTLNFLEPQDLSVPYVTPPEVQQLLDEGAVSAATATSKAAAAAASATTAGTARDEAVVAKNAAQAVGTTTDGVMTGVDGNAASTFRVQSDARLSATIAQLAGPLIASLEAVPFANYGDSYGQGAQGASQESRPFNRIASRYRTGTLAVRSVAGTRMDQIAAAVASTWTPNSLGLVGISDGCINDEKQYADLTGIPTTVAAFRASLAFLTARAVSAIDSAAFVFGSGWAAGTSSTAGSYFDVAFVGRTGHLRLSHVTTTGGTYEVRNAAGTVVASGTTGGLKQAFVGAVKLAGNATTSTSYRVALLAGTLTVSGVTASSPTPPVIVWDKPGRMNNLDSETARLNAYLDACAAITPDFPSLVSADMGADWDYATMISEDSTHRNDRGNIFAADRIEVELSAFLAGDTRQGLNRLSSPLAAAAYVTPAAAYSVAGATAPGQVTSLATTGTNDTSATLSWVRPSDGGATLSGYSVQYRVSGATQWITSAASVAPASTSATVPGLASSTAYEFRVAAVNASGTGTYSTTATGTTAAPPVVYASDSFARADSSTLGSTELGAFAWSVINAARWTIASGALACGATSGVTAPNDVFVDDAQANGTISLKLLGLPTSTGLAFRVGGSGNVNGFIFWAGGSTWTLSRRTAAGAYTAVATGTGTPAAGDTLSVVLNGSSIVCKVNGVAIITATDANYQANTRHGVWTNANISATTYDNFSHTDALV